MTPTPAQTQARRFARHPMQRTERIVVGNARIGWLGDPAHQPIHQTESQQTANELIAAEHALANTQTRYVIARRAAAEELRLYGPAGAYGRGAATRAELESAEATRDLALRRIEELRHTLHAQRRAELAGGDAPVRIDAHRQTDHSLRVGASGSWLHRVLGRAAS